MLVNSHNLETHKAGGIIQRLRAEELILKFQFRSEALRNQGELGAGKDPCGSEVVRQRERI